MNEPLIEFNPKLPKLSKNERAVLKLLVEAGKLIVPLYLEQENQQRISKEELEKAAKKNSEILSPYAVVEKINGKIIATPYHIKYAKFLKPIAERLEEAAKITENKEFGQALKIQAKALLEGTYEEAMAAWFRIEEPYIIDISIGPLDHLAGRIPFGKFSYQCWVGVLDIEGTKRLNNYKSIILSTSRKTLVPKEHIDNLDNVKAKTIDVILLSGLIARTRFVGLNLPTNINLVAKYGSEVTILNQCNDLRLKEQIFPYFNKIFSRLFRQSFNKEDIRRGYLRITALHELAHSLLYYKNSLKNLQDLFPCINELSAAILGLRMAGPLLLKDRITEKQLESMIVTFTCRSFYLMERKEIDKSMVSYALGSTIFINFMLESGALRRINNLMVLNFTKMFMSLHELLPILEGLLSKGTRKDAEIFIKKYSKYL